MHKNEVRYYNWFTLPYSKNATLYMTHTAVKISLKKTPSIFIDIENKFIVTKGETSGAEII